MKRLGRAALLTRLADSLLKNGSWCGETHLQKSTYLLQTALGVPMDVDYVFYKHGPYSFDLHDELTSLRADGLFRMESQAYPYGPKLVPTSEAESLSSKFPKTLGRYGDAINKVSDFVGSATVAELERLSTALYVICEEEKIGDEAVDRITALKPHVSPQQAKAAIARVEELV